jgi:hypothetical protein
MGKNCLTILFDIYSAAVMSQVSPALKRRRWCVVLSSLFLIGAPAVSPQVRSSRPVRSLQPVTVIDLRDSTQSETGMTCDDIRDITEVGTRWAVLLDCPAQKSALVWGDEKSKHFLSVDGPFDRIAMDSAYNLVLRSVPAASSDATIGLTRAIVLDATGAVSRRLTIKSRGVRPFQVAGTVRWATQSGSFTDAELNSVDTAHLNTYILTPTKIHLNGSMS